MHRSIRLLAVAAAATASLAAPFAASAGGRPLATDLLGANEIQPADPDGSGTAQVWVNPGLTQVCYTLEVTGLDPVIGAHIHAAPAGVNGPIVVPLAPPTSGSSSGCVDVTRELAKAITMNPAGYYVNVHTTVFPAGALRGQLG